MDVHFTYSIGDRVRIKASQEEGVVRSACIDNKSDAQFLIHYKAADGRAVSAWWDEDQIEKC